MSVKGKEGRFRALLDGAWRTGGSEVFRDRERLLDGVVGGRALTEQGFGVTLVLELYAGGELQPEPRRVGVARVLLKSPESTIRAFPG